MNHPQSLHEFTALELKKQIKSFFSGYDFEELSTNSNHIITLLSKLDSKYTYHFFKRLDAINPRVSFHYIMEASQLSYNQSIDVKLRLAAILLIFRISYLMAFSPEKNIFAPVRKNMFHQQLLNHDYFDSGLLHELHIALNNVDDMLCLPKSEKKHLKKVLQKTFFTQHLKNISELSTINE